MEFAFAGVILLLLGISFYFGKASSKREDAEQSLRDINTALKQRRKDEEDTSNMSDDELSDELRR